MNESNIFGVSVRSLLAFIIVLSFCGLAVYLKEVDLLKDLTLIAVSFYFGQKPAPSTPNSDLTTKQPIPTEGTK